jgi:hypothetical protein
VGIIAGVSVAAAVLIACVVVGAVFMVKRAQKREQRKSYNAENPDAPFQIL